MMGIKLNNMRTLEGIKTELFYIETASTLRFSEIVLNKCHDQMNALCGELFFDEGDGYIFVDLVGEGTLYIDDEIHAVFKTPEGGHENRFIPISSKGLKKIMLRPAVVGPFGEKLFNFNGLYLYVKEPWSFRFVIEANLLTDLAGYTRDERLIYILNKALDQIDIEGVTEWQLKASSLYSISRPPFYISSVKYYDIKLDPDIMPMDPKKLAEMSRSALDLLHRELENIYRELVGSIGMIYAVGHAHIDVSWLWPPDVTKRKVIRTLKNVLTLSKRYPMKFALSNMLYLKWLREEDPDLYKKILEAIKKEIIIPVGGMWVESDTNIIGGESLVRQFLYGQRLLLKEIGRITEVGWLPDSFGYTGSLPQILRKSGIKIFFTHKLYWNKQNRFPYSLFIWEGVDGTEIITVNYATYGSNLSPQQIMGAWKDHTSPFTPAFIAFGFGDGGGGPTWIMMERLRIYSQAPGMPKIVLADPYEYYKIVRDHELPRWRGELYLEIHRGTYSTGHKIKKLIRMLEEKLKDLEIISFMAGEKRNYKDLWEMLLEAEFHDTASATLVNEAYNYYIDGLERLDKEVDEKINEVLRRISGEGEYLNVVNTLPWDRRDVVRGAVKGAVQQIIDGEVYSLVNASGMSITSFEIGEGAPADPLQGDDQKISNGLIEFYRDGYIKDLENNIDVVKRSYVIACRDIPAEWDGWDIDPWYTRSCRELKPVEIRLVEKGPLRACIEREYVYRKTVLREKICLWRDSRRIDFRIKGFVADRFVLFKELLELSFDPIGAEAEIPYGVIRRSVAPQNPWDEAKFEFPVWRWLDIYTTDYGLAIINKGRSGHSINKRIVGITLLKTPIFPNPHLDHGEIDIEFALYPHKGGWREAEIPRKSLEYHRPLKSIKGSYVNKRFIKIDHPNILLETIKISEDGEDYVMRLWETYGRRTSLKLEGEELDLLELKGERKDLITFDPYEIKTIKIRNI